MALAFKKVLITGIESFTGKHLSTYLKSQGFEVSGTTYETCDISKKEDLEKALKQTSPDYIIHLAGISFAAHDDAEDFYKVNTIGTLNILDTLLKLNINPQKIILASSATVYGNQNKEVLDESLCPAPTNHYGTSKYAMETLTKNYFDKLNIIIARPFNYTGVGQAEHFLIPKIVSHFKQNKTEIELGNLHVSREFNDINYVCNIYKKLLLSQAKSKVVNICSNRGIKLLDIIETMNQIAKYNIKVKVNPNFVRKDDIKTLTGSSKELFKIVGNIKQEDFKNTLRVMFET